MLWFNYHLALRGQRYGRCWFYFATVVWIAITMISEVRRVSWSSETWRVVCTSRLYIGWRLQPLEKTSFKTRQKNRRNACRHVPRPQIDKNLSAREYDIRSDSKFITAYSQRWRKTKTASTNPRAIRLDTRRLLESRMNNVTGQEDVCFYNGRPLQFIRWLRKIRFWSIFSITITDF